MTLLPGKLSAAIMAGLLASIQSTDKRVLLGPRVGRDAAVIDLGDGRVLVATTDPITFATDQIGRYAVNVNANDVACMGACPAWFLATVLLPPASDEKLPALILAQITDACAELDVALVGGHTEVTASVTSPVVVGTMLGEAPRGDVIIDRPVAPGDAVLLAGGMAIEGTALLARECAPKLSKLGVPSATINRASVMLLDPGISVVTHAAALCAMAKPRLMHDATEGGIATALEEMSVAFGSRLEVDLGAIEIYDETRAICDALGLDPLGLLASGALLAIVSPEDAAQVASRRNEEVAKFRQIGVVVEGPPGVILRDDDSEISMPVFERDEVARFFDSATGMADTK